MVTVDKNDGNGNRLMASYGDFGDTKNLSIDFFFCASFPHSGIASLLISERKENPPTSTTPSDGKKMQDQEQGHITKPSPISDESEDSPVTKNEDTITASQEQGKQLSHEVQKPFDKVRDGDKGTELGPTTEPKAKKPSFFESFHVLKDPRFMSLTLAELTASIGYLIPYYYMQSKFPSDMPHSGLFFFLFFYFICSSTCK